MSKVHLLAGPNNSGKSNVLRMMQRALPSLQDRKQFDVSDLDRPQGRAEASREARLAIGFRAADLDLAEIRIQDRWPPDEFWHRVFSLEPNYEPDPDGLLWFEFSSEGDTSWSPGPSHIDRLYGAAEHLGRPAIIEDLSGMFTNTRGGGRRQDGVRAMEGAIDRLRVRELLPAVDTINAIRQLGPATANQGERIDHDGPGLLERLAALQHPAFDRPADRERFEDINRFVRKLFNDDSANIEVPHDRSTLLVYHEGRRLPLENYGTGLHQVVILAAAATVLENQLVCIEEPEVHLHPVLQRTLLLYLTQQTSNQYVVATHSAHLLDAARSSISAVRRIEGQSCVKAAVTPSAIALLSTELGARASDLVQANSLVWVEGPSDRIYLRHWLSLLDARLTEGVHYSLMFYGGRLLRSLSPEDAPVAEFIALPRINRNFAVVIDSDRERAGQRINATKTRVREGIEAADPNTVVWVTKGYTIENYVTPEVLRAAVAKTHDGTTCRWTGNPHVNPLHKGQLKGRKAVDKIAVAREVVSCDAVSWRMDLRQQVLALARMIWTANDMEPPRKSAD